MSRLTRALLVIQPLVVVVGFVVVGLLLRREWGSLASYRWNLDPSWLAASAALMAAGWLIELRLWQRIIAIFGGSLEYWAAARIWFISAIARYVPGNVWQPLSLTVLCRKRGVRPEAAFAGLSLFQAMHLLAISSLTVCYLAVWGASSEWLRSVSDWRAAIVAIPVICFVVRPSWMLRIINRALVQLGREALPVRLSTGLLVRFLLIAMAAWACLSCGFVALAKAITPAVSRGAVPHFAAAYLIAYAIGFLSVLTPGGLIVREGVLYVLISPFVGPQSAIVISIAMRTWEIVLEMTAAASALAFGWFRR